MFLHNLEISNFRAFKSVQLNDLGRVNLLVGKNNCGKTSVLEALRVFAGNGSLQSLLALAIERNDTGPQGFLEGDGGLKALVAGLFKDYDFENNSKIVIGDTKQGKTVTIEYVTDESLDELRVIGHYGKPKKIKFNDSLRSSLTLNSAKGEKPPTPLFVVRAKNNNDQELAFLLDEISLDDTKKKQVIAALNLVESKIKNLSFIASESVSDIFEKINSHKNILFKKRIPFVRLANSNLNIPLNSMGDGMHRILDIVLHLVSAENGILLIDEFENGLHYALQEKLWGLIFKIAKELSVQVFVTTHSDDCVSAFARVSAETDEEGVLYRITKPQQADEPHFVRRYSEERLSEALDAEVEVR